MTDKRKSRTPEQKAETVAKRKATIAAKSEKLEFPAEPVLSTEVEKAEVKAAAEASAEDRKSEASPDKKSEQPAQLPKALTDRIEAMAGIQDDLADQIKKFKSGEAYLEGDIPFAMHGVGGPGFNPGQRALNYMNPDHLDPLYHFRWSHKSMVDYHRADGYVPCDHVDFSRMIIARGGGHSFGKTPEGHVYSGDLILIQVSQDWHDHLASQVRLRTKAKEGRAKNNVYAKGESLGFDVYEGGEAMSPKMDRLLKFIEKELGPGAVDAYLGR